MTGSDTQNPDSRVHAWVHQFSANGNEFLQTLATNFTYYLDHVEEYNENTVDHTDLPALGEPEKLAMHAGIRVGVSWGKEATLHIVTGRNDEFINAFGIESNAVACVETNTLYSKRTVTPDENAAQDKIKAMKNASSTPFTQLAECLEVVLERETELAESDVEVVAEAMPHFSQRSKRIILFSILFGRLWEYSDPALWVILGPGRSFEAVHATAREAAAATQDRDNYSSEPLTPRDNDRHS